MGKAECVKKIRDGCGLGARTCRSRRFVEPAPRSGRVVEVFDFFLVALLFLGLNGLRRGANASRPGRIVVTPPPGVRRGRYGAKGDGQGECGKRSLHSFHLDRVVARRKEGRILYRSTMGRKGNGDASGRNFWDNSSFQRPHLVSDSGSVD